MRAETSTASNANEGGMKPSWPMILNASRSTCAAITRLSPLAARAFATIASMGSDRCRNQQAFAKTGHAVFIIGDYLQAEGMLIISAYEMFINVLLERQEVVVIVKEREDVRFFGRGNLHPAKHHQSVPLTRFFHGQNVFRRIMIAHADQVHSLAYRRAHHFTRRHIKTRARGQARMHV